MAILVTHSELEIVLAGSLNRCPHLPCDRFPISLSDDGDRKTRHGHAFIDRVPGDSLDGRVYPEQFPVDPDPILPVIRVIRDGTETFCTLAPLFLGPFAFRDVPRCGENTDHLTCFIPVHGGIVEDRRDLALAVAYAEFVIAYEALME